jgi:hypothetical protein
MKIFEKVLDERLKRLINIDGRQFGFRSGKSTTDAVFILRQMQEKFEQKNRKLHHVFVDLEKALDRVPRGIIEWALRRPGVPETLLAVNIALYVCEDKISGDDSGCVFGDVDITVGVRQGSALSPLLFIIVLEEVTKECKSEEPLELLCVDDLKLTVESRQGVTDKFNGWKAGMEKKGLNINMDKTMVMVTGKEAREKIQSGR